MGHQAVDGLSNLFRKSSHDLTIVHDKLEKEFSQIYPNNANPMKLVARVKKIEEELSSLSQQCRELLAAKQDLIDKATTTLVGNRLLLQRLQASSGIPITDEADDPAHSNFHKIIEEWTNQMRSKADIGNQESEAEDINHQLFSAIVPEN